MKKGDVFVLGGKRYMYAYTRGMNLYVKGNIRKSPTIPSWFSEMLPLSFDSALEINRFRKLLKERLNSKTSKKDTLEFIQNHLYTDKKTSEAIYNYFNEQNKFLEIPDSKSLLIEKYHSPENKNYLIVHSMYGRRVNDALSRALAYIIAKSKKRDIEIGINDNGFYLSGETLPIEKAIKDLSKKDLKKVLSKAIEKTDVLKRRFRHCAARSLMILRNYKGRNKSVGKQQMKSHFLLSSVKKITKKFPILREARREVLEDLMDIKNAEQVLEWIKENKIKVKIVNTHLPSPFAINLIIQGHADLIKIEQKQEFLKRIHQLHMRKINKK